MAREARALIGTVLGGLTGCSSSASTNLDAEFEAAKGFEDNVVLTESALDEAEVAIAFRPREEWPKAFKFYRLYR